MEELRRKMAEDEKKRKEEEEARLKKEREMEELQRKISFVLKFHSSNAIFRSARSETSLLLKPTKSHKPILACSKSP